MMAAIGTILKFSFKTEHLPTVSDIILVVGTDGDRVFIGTEVSTNSMRVLKSTLGDWEVLSNSYVSSTGICTVTVQETLGTSLGVSYKAAYIPSPYN